MELTTNFRLLLQYKAPPELYNKMCYAFGGLGNSTGLYDPIEIVSTLRILDTQEFFWCVRAINCSHIDKLGLYYLAEDLMSFTRQFIHTYQLPDAVIKVDVDKNNSNSTVWSMELTKLNRHIHKLAADVFVPPDLIEEKIKDIIKNFFQKELH